MAAPSIPEIMSGVATRLQTITGLHVAEVHTGQVTTPMAVVGVPTIPSYRLAMRRGTFEISVAVHVFVSAAVDVVGQTAIAAYANPTGSSSIVAAIEGDRTLGSKVDDCFVESFRPFGIDEVNTVGYWGGLFTLFVAAQGGT